MKQVRVLVVDDSYFMRQTLVKFLTTPYTKVIDTAKNGQEAVQKVEELQPDIVTMDIEMPVMDGIEALSIIMNENPVPVIMISTLTGAGADATIDALSIGAVDFIQKRSAFKDNDSVRDELVKKVVEIGSNSSLKNQFIRKRLLNHSIVMKDKVHSNVNIPLKEQIYDSKPSTSSAGTIRKRATLSKTVKIVGVGISTGGPVALQQFIPKLPEKFPVPIIIAQHMPAQFTKSLAARLDSMSYLNVVEAQNGDVVSPGTVYISPGGRQTRVTKKGTILVSDEPETELYKPSVNILMNSLLESFGQNVLGIIMTGMGNDGAVGLKNLFNAGGFVMAQSVDSCVVSGMTKSVIEANVCDEIVDLEHIGETVSKFFNLHAVEPKILKK